MRIVLATYLLLISFSELFSKNSLISVLKPEEDLFLFDV